MVIDDNHQRMVELVKVMDEIEKDRSVVIGHGNPPPIPPEILQLELRDRLAERSGNLYGEIIQLFGIIGNMTRRYGVPIYNPPKQKSRDRCLYCGLPAFGQSFCSAECNHAHKEQHKAENKALHKRLRERKRKR